MIDCVSTLLEKTMNDDFSKPVVYGSLILVMMLTITCIVQGLYIVDMHSQQQSTPKVIMNDRGTPIPLDGWGAAPTPIPEGVSQ